MARIIAFVLAVGVIQASPSNREERQVTTCPGFPGYCSESYPGDTCLVVCAFGRNNVPECQADGTWTDVPRCIEHEPGIPEQLPGICPGIPGYCSLSHTGELCEFDCLTGSDIRSFCTPDGTWDPYPTCQGDVRETRDGCDPCPGPFGGARNRASEGQGQGPQQTAAAVNPFQQPKQPAQRPNNNRRNNNNNRRNNGNNRRNNRPQPSQPAARPNSGGRRNNRPQPTQLQVQTNNRPQQFQPQRKQPQQQQTFQRFQQSPARPSQNSLGGQCPGNALEACIDVCPSFSARVFGACVSGCARRCPNRK